MVLGGIILLVNMVVSYSRAMRASVGIRASGLSDDGYWTIAVRSFSTAISYLLDGSIDISILVRN